MSAIKEIKKILIIHASGRIGDSLIAIPAIVAIQHFYQFSYTDLLVHKNNISLFENIPSINLLGSISDKRARWRGWFDQNKYDLVFVFNHTENLYSILSYALRVGKKVIAFKSKNKNINDRLFIAKSKFNKKVHFINYFNGLIESLGIISKNNRIRIFLKKEEYDYARRLLLDSGLTKDNYLIGYQMTSSKINRQWPEESFIQLSNKIKTLKPNVKFIFFGSNFDKLKISKTINIIGARYCLDLSGLSLRRTAAIMSNLNLYLGMDTGPSYLMSAFDIPFICIYGPQFRSTLSSPFDHPCAILIDHPSKNKSSPMSEIKVKDVFSKIKKFL